ncbi:MAG TPA: iron-sulfur cluster assembly protein [Solirubrobacteraceae bacterium]|nr:iron-sulfur cluster assembly protein [Solirubrobacteraceae bacterium]
MDTPPGSLIQRVVQALSRVIDPELDESITALRFVREVLANGHGDVEVRLRLPTPQCAPNFAFLMGADARRVVAAVPGVRSVTVRLEDHYTGEEINQALSRGQGFSAAFPGESADDGLETLRAIFTRKALIGRQSTLCEQLLGEGWSPEEIVASRLGDLPPGALSRRIRELRGQLGLDSSDAAPGFVQPGGEPVGLPELERWRRAARLMRLSLEANGGICRDLLAARHGLSRDPHDTPPLEVLT